MVRKHYIYRIFKNNSISVLLDYEFDNYDDALKFPSQNISIYSDSIYEIREAFVSCD